MLNSVSDEDNTILFQNIHQSMNSTQGFENEFSLHVIFRKQGSDSLGFHGRQHGHFY